MLYLPPDPKPGQPIRPDTVTAILKYLRQITPRTSAHCGVQVGAGGATLHPTMRRTRRGVLSNPAAWPFKVYNTSRGSTGQVQINGGDGFVASLNGFVANVGGHPNDTLISGVYPQLAVTGNGVIYGYAVPATAGTASPLTSLDIDYAGSVPALDSATPATYYPWLLATITGWAVDGSGNVSFSVNNATNYGWTTLIYCGSGIQIY